MIVAGVLASTRLVATGGDAGDWSSEGLAVDETEDLRIDIRTDLAVTSRPRWAGSSAALVVAVGPPTAVMIHEGAA